MSTRPAALAESLEPRRLLAAVAWDGGGDGINWIDPLNWDTDSLPTAADDVTIDVATDPTIVLSEFQSVNSLTSSEDFVMAASLEVAAGQVADFDAAFSLAGGTFAYGTLDVSDATATVNNSGLNQLFGDVTLRGTLRLDQAAARLRVFGGLTLDGGTILLADQDAVLSFTGSLATTQDIDGNGGITSAVSEDAQEAKIELPRFKPVSIDTGVVIGGGDGNLRIGSSSGNSAVGHLRNYGTVLAGPGGQVVFNVDSLTNAGALRVTGGSMRARDLQNEPGGRALVDDGGGLTLLGRLDNLGTIEAESGGWVTFSGNYVASDIGDLRRTGGSVRFNGTLDNAGGVLDLVDLFEGPVEVSGGTVRGGTLDTGGVPLPVGSMRLADGVTLRGTLDVSRQGSEIRVDGGLTLDDAAVILGGAATTLVFDGGFQTLAGRGSVTSVAPADDFNSRRIVLHAGATLVVGPEIVIGGNSLQITSSGSGRTELFNQGLIRASGTMPLRLDVDRLSNIGTLATTDGGTLDVTPSVDGTLAIGGVVLLAGGGTLSTFQQVRILNANLVIEGTGNGFGGGLTATVGLHRIQGTLTLAEGASLDITPSGTLRLEGDVDLAPGARIYVDGSAGFAGNQGRAIRTAIGPGGESGQIVATGTVNLNNPDGGPVRLDAEVVGGFDPAQGERFDIISGSQILDDVDAFFGDTTPGGNLLLIGRDNTALYAEVGTGTPPPAPSVVDVQFDFETREAVVFTFNTNVSAFVSRSDVTLTNTTTGQVIDESAGRFDYGQAGDSAAFVFTGEVPDGNYQLVIDADDISNAAGQTLTDPIVFDFFVLAGDFNRDRSVNLSDFTILANNFGRGGRTFSQGDANYDEQVNLSDFTVLANRFGATLPPSAGDDEGGLF